jgi:hypothetical protein
MDSRALLLCVLLLALLSGCQKPGAQAPRLRVEVSPAGAVEMVQTGDAAAPAKVETSAGTASFDIPAGSPVTIGAQGVTFTPAAPVAVSLRVAAATLAGPVAFPPPAAPTPEQAADGRARWWAWVWIGLGAVAAGLGLTQGWRLVGIGGLCFVAAGVCVIALGSVPGWVWGLAGVGLLVAVSGWAVWTFYLGPREHRARLAALRSGDTPATLAPGAVTA